MSDSDLPTHIVIGAAQRAATHAGAGFYIRKRGEAGRGTILLALSDQAGGFRLYRQVWDGERRILAEMQSGEEMEIEAAITREIDFDPDLWVVEIEDRKARLFFDKIFLQTDTIQP